MDGPRQSDELPDEDHRPADPDIESILEEGRPTDVPDDDRAVPEDINEYVLDEPEYGA